MKRWRRGTLRYQAENARIEAWLAQISRLPRVSPQLALEVARCQRLVKGYSDTHERGMRNFETLMAAVRKRPARDAARRRRCASCAMRRWPTSTARRWARRWPPPGARRRRLCDGPLRSAPPRTRSRRCARWCSPTACTATCTSSHELFELEQEHFFANTWNYVGHDSQIPKAGDYLTRRDRRPAADRRAPRRRQRARADEPLRAQGLARWSARPAATPASSSAARTTPGPTAPTARCSNIPLKNGYEGTRAARMRERPRAWSTVKNVRVYRGFIFAKLNDAGPELRGVFRRRR